MVRFLQASRLVVFFFSCALIAACNAAPTPIPAPPTFSTVVIPITPTPRQARPAADASRTPVPNTPTPRPTPTATPTPLHPLMVAVQRQRTYEASEIKIEQTLAPGANYNRYIASYQSDGLKIYALLTVPRGAKPTTGFPAIIFNHGYIPPPVYRTTERYVDYVDMIARSGYIVLKSDYRGHGSSEGEARGGYGSPDYTIDVLNALASMKKYPDADPNRIGMWGHSMGGYITLRAMVIDPDIKAGVIWGGVVASYSDLLSRWRRPGRTELPPSTSSSRRWRNELVEDYGTPEENPAFWESISANSFLFDLGGPIQLHHGTADSEVPLEFSQTLYQQIQAVGGEVELYTYQGDNHNISNNMRTAMTRSIQFFDKYIKGQ